MKNVIQTVTQHRRYSEAAWDAAIATDDQNSGFAADRDACSEAYDRALAELAEGNFDAAISALEDAAWLEKQAGDDSDAQSAILAVLEAWRASI